MKALLRDAAGLIKAALRRLRTRAKTIGKSRYLQHGDGLHLGANVRIWAPDHVRIGRCVYIGKGTHIEANATIGDFCLIANEVAIVGRNDHDYKAIGTPVRFSPWVADYAATDPRLMEEVNIGDDVWVGYRSTILTGVTIGRGAIVAAGSVVVKNVEPYDIVAGVPARRVGRRFTDAQIVEHERSIATGEFSYSPRGLRYCTIRPGLPTS